MTRVAILVSGGGSNMVALAESMTGDHPARPCVVLSNVPGAAALDKAAARGIPAVTVDHRGHADRAGFEAALDAALGPYAPDLLCLAGFMRILSGRFVDRWQGRILNIHPSLLPAYRGLDTHTRALADGAAEHGCTVHLVTPALDDGPILGQARVPVHPGDDAATLEARVRQAEHRLYPAVLRRFVEHDTAPVQLP